MYQPTSFMVLWMAQALFGVVTMDSGQTPNHSNHVCSTWGSYHFKTFDGDYYEFPGSCTYNFVSHCGGSYSDFSVHIHRSNDSNHPVIDKILITIKDVNIELRTSIAVVSGLIAVTPYYRDGIVITKSVAYFKVYTKTGFTLMWNKGDAIMVELDPIYNNYTCGLCGDYNGINDFSVEGRKLSPIQFGNLQNIYDPKETCTDLDETKAIIDTSSCSQYRLVCENRLGDAAFADCREFLNLEAYINACMLDMCSCGQSPTTICLCSTISEFSRQCSHAGGHPGNWRTDSFCPIECPNNMIYQESSSPCMNTCSNLDSNHVCLEHYIDDCFCPEGTVQDDYTEQGCVPVSECHCIYQERLYRPGEMITNDCNTCHCISGIWNCTDHACPGPCSIEGGAHITTFDGKSYTFHGDCYYVLSKEFENSSHVILGEITRISSLETILKSIMVFMDDRKNVVTFKTDGKVLLNDQGVTLPQVTATFSISQPTDSYIILNAAFGLQMQIQLQPMMQLYITMDTSFIGKLQGLCGNFNYMEIDDFQISGGLVEATASAFANTWKTNAMCPDVSDWLDDPCSLSIENKKYADHWCSLLEDNTSPFAKCHLTIKPAEYAKRCHYDSCSCKDSEKCMCAALSSYVRACAAKGIILWGWRKGICDKYTDSCPSSKIYLYNLTTCQPTCHSLAEGDKACASGFTAVDGCGCPDGEFLNEKDQCVPISQCSCYNDGSYVNPLESITKQNEHCTCHDGKLVCSPFHANACSNEKVYYDCNNQTNAPNQRSCKTLATGNFPTACISGCVCPNGLLDDGAGGCVPEEDCPCSYKEDIYRSGTTIDVDCNTCFCQSGSWDCTKNVCYRTCSIYGSGHYVTFDEKLYDFDGKCEFVAATDYCGPNHSTGTFSIVTENVPCGTTGVTCSRAIKVFLGNKILKLADRKLEETASEGEKSVSYLTREVGLYLVIQTDNDILLIWDKKTTVFIKVSPTYKGNLCGLCGNFDGNSQNDFMAKNMLQVVNVLEFGNSWKSDSACPDATEVVKPCLKNPHRQAWAEKQCGLIKGDVFKICHSKVDPLPFYEACVSDACACDSGGDCECFCTAVAAYAQECTKAKACVNWRTPDICPIFCDYYNPKDECQWHYHPCGNHSMKTCRSINNVYTNVTITYLEGCYPTCPKDKPIYDEFNRICVRPERCGCFINNTRYGIGDPIPNYKISYNCNCTEGGIYCVISDTSVSTTSPWTMTTPTSTRSEDCFVKKIVNGTEKMEHVICPTSIPITTSVTSTTVTTTTVSTSTACVPKKVCQWTEWFDVNKPSDGLDGGDYETYEEIRKRYTFCSMPKQIECRAVNAPDVSLEDLKQNVHCNVSNGLICKNSDQPSNSLWQKCFNYKIRVNCCDYDSYDCSTTTRTTTPTTTTETSTVSTTTPITTTSPTTTMTATPTTTTETSTATTTTPITTTSPTTTTMTTTPTTTTETTPVTTTTSITTTVPICKKCEWSRWFDVSSPTLEPNGGDFETYANIRKAGYDVCEKPEQIACRSTRSPNSSLESNGQFVTCNVSSGLICRNNDQEGDLHLCFDYEISVCCCQESTPITTTLSTSPSTITETTTSTEWPTTSEVTSPTTPFTSTTLTTTPSTTTLTQSTTTTFSTTTPSCAPVCSWSPWFDVSYPNSTTNWGDFETYKNIREAGFHICEKPQGISCRSKETPDTALEELRQNVTCDVSYGLECYKNHPVFPCINFEIKVFCCTVPTICTTQFTSTILTTKPSTTTVTETTTSTEFPTTSEVTTPTTPFTSTTLTTMPSTTTVTETTTSTEFPTTSEVTTPTTPFTSTTLTTMPSTTTLTQSTTTTFSTTTPSCAPVCSWSPWFDVSYPNSTTNWGDFETYENIREAGFHICEKPQGISCRSKETPDTALEELRQNVTCDVSYGLECYKNHPVFPCINFEIKVFCCTVPTICTTPFTSTTLTTTPSTTTVTETTTSTEFPTTSEVTTPTTPFTSTTLTTTPSTTTLTQSTTTTFSTTTPSCAPVCSWSPWFDVSYPNSTTNWGDFETYKNIREAGFHICEKPQGISCRSKETPDTALEELRQNVTCDVSYGLECYKNHPVFPCINFEIKVFCCTVPTICTTPFTSTILTTTPSTTTVTETTTSTEFPTTSEVTTPTTPFTSTTLTTTPSTTTVTETTTSTEFPTTSEVTTPTTPFTSTTLTTMPSTTTLTQSTTTTFSTTTPSCAPVCSWSPWFDVSYPNSTTNWGDFETYKNIREAAFHICEKPQGISCRSKETPDTALEELRQNVTCDVSYGLECYKNHPVFPCINFEIKVFCCTVPTICTTPFTSTTLTTMPSTTTVTETITSTELTTTSEVTSLTTPSTSTTLTTTPSTTTVTETTTSTELTTTLEVTSPTTPFTSTTLTITPSTTTVTETTTSTEFPTTSEVTTPTTPFTSTTLTTTPSTTTVTETTTSTELTTTSEVTTPTTPFTSTTLTTTPSTTTVTETTTSTELTTTLEVTTPTTPFTSTTLTTTPSTITVTETTTSTEFPTTSEVTSSTTPFTSTTLTTTPSTTTVTETTTSTEFPTTSEVTSPTTPFTSTTLTTTPSTTTVTQTTTPTSSTTRPTTTSATITFVNTTTPESTTTSATPCVCSYNGVTYPEGDIKSGAFGKLCYRIVCSETCTVTSQSWDCEPPTTTTPTSTASTSAASTTTPTSETSSTTKQSTHSTVSSSTFLSPPPDCLLVPPRKYNETWKIDNCTVARCLGGTSVNITSTKCKPQPPITCVNGLPPISVTDDDQCCQHWECQCSCFGWGDPHFYTFDGTFYDFQGTCTYTLVEEIIKKISTFGVYIDNYDCGAKDGVSCPRDIIVKYENQTIRLQKTFQSKPTVQVIVNDAVVGTPYANNGVKVYASGINYVVEIPSIQSFIKYDGFRFEINLPYHRFGNNTQGHCGTCTNNRSDDCLTKSGNYVSKCEDMAPSWIYNYTNNPNCVIGTTTVSPVVSVTQSTKTTTCTPSPTCEIIKDTIFQECHKLYPPELYYRTCIFDSCHSYNMECSSLEQYAQLCAGQGICIPWRNNTSKCRLTCPSDKVYKACGPIKQRTCQTTPEQYAVMQNNTRLIEGCFCPEGTMRHSEAVDKCVPDCGCVGPDNVPRRFGETFQLGCLDCVCREGGSGLYCDKHKCSMNKNVTCEQAGFIPVTRIDSNDPCCNETVCICDINQCPSKPSCTIGYEAVDVIANGSCCTLYNCVPKKVCVHENAEYMPGTKVFLDKCKDCVCSYSDSGAEIQCTNVSCNKQCPRGYELMNSTSDCCGDCIQTHCVINDKHGLSLLEPGESRKSKYDSCKVYNCTLIKGQFSTSVSQTPCPYFNEDNCVPGTIELSPNGCCKQCIETSPSCKLNQKLEYLSHNDCQSEHLVNITYCEGPCNTLSIYSLAASKMSHTCTCCQEVKTTERTVTMRCSNGRREELSYVKVEECNCVSNDCESSQLQKTFTTGRARRFTRDKK
ncbi:mucin-2-like [Lithobates pipiens]